MMHILDLSYKFLPRRLQACFLYLGTYPEDFDIEKDDLVGKWVSEGFVSGPSRRGEWCVAEGYLNELVNRSMIQLVPRSYHDYIAYKAPCYKVHDMMLELILKKCRENNFVRLAHYQQESKAELQVKVRRLTVNICDPEDDTTVDVISGRHLPQVRSLSLFGANCVPPLSKLRFLRVLFLLIGHSSRQGRVDLTCLSQLSQLRYLKVKHGTHPVIPVTIDIVLPSQIRSMQHLERLETQDLRIGDIAPDIADLPCLTHLILQRPWGSLREMNMLPDGIGKVKSLRALRDFMLPADSSHIIEGLGELTNLAELSLGCRRNGQFTDPIPTTTAWMAAWSSSLNKLSNLRMLRVHTYPSCCADALSSWVSPPFPFLEELDVKDWTFSRVPRWIGGLHNLHSLHFGVKEVSTFSCRDDVRIVGMLPNLIVLQLRIEGDVPVEGIVISRSTGFKLLERFYLHIRSTSELAFEAGAMPNLRMMELTFDKKESDRATVPVGLEHLGSLRTIDIACASDAFIDMFREATKGLPSELIISSFYRIGKFRPREDDKN